jgi:hypothetical protein
MEIKPTKLRLSKLNITKLRELLNSCPLEEKDNIEKRIKILQDKNKAKKNISPWSDNSSKTSIEEIPIHQRCLEQEEPRKTVDIHTATKLLRQYYADKFGNGPSVNDVSKTISMDCDKCDFKGRDATDLSRHLLSKKHKSLEQPSEPGLLASLDKEYEVVEISIKLLKKINI